MYKFIIDIKYYTFSFLEKQIYFNYLKIIINNLPILFKFFFAINISFRFAKKNF